MHYIISTISAISLCTQVYHVKVPTTCSNSYIHTEIDVLLENVQRWTCLPHASYLPFQLKVTPTYIHTRQGSFIEASLNKPHIVLTMDSLSLWIYIVCIYSFPNVRKFYPQINTALELNATPTVQLSLINAALKYTTHYNYCVDIYIGMAMLIRCVRTRRCVV